ncbi:MAG: UpxY family transcription antiterminator [Pirellulales bacterium]|nr:UpxY family transcription antiterminator [Pirellulales bacterium]
MPILTQNTAIFPETLFEPGGVDAPGRTWWVLYTKSRQEKAVARQLAGYGLPFYLPLVPKDHLIRGRVVRSQVPLFAGYVFLLGTDQERIAALTTNRVAHVLVVDDDEQLWMDLRQVHQLIASNAPLTVERRLAPGQRVRVKQGALCGIEGTVLARRRAPRLLVAVSMLQQGVSVAIDDYMLEPVS